MRYDLYRVDKWFGVFANGRCKCNIKLSNIIERKEAYFTNSPRVLRYKPRGYLVPYHFLVTEGYQP